MSETKTNDYRDACSGVGPLADEWADKPHRLVYDLCTANDAARQLIQQLTEALGELAEYAAACELTMKADGSIPMDADDSRSLRKARAALAAASQPVEREG